MTMETAPTSRVAAADRRRAVERRLRSLGAPRPAHRAPPPEGRLSPDEQPASRVHAALASLGPVFADFGRYLSTRIDLLPRRDCLELAADDQAYTETRDRADVAALVGEQLGGPVDVFHDIDPVPRRVTRWTQQHRAWLATAVPVAITIVRPDAEEVLAADLPLLPLLRPWLGLSPQALDEAIADFARTLRQRIDLSQQVLTLAALAEDAQAGGPFDAPECYREYSTRQILTTARLAGAAVADAANPLAAARRLAAAWVRQALTGRVVPFDFDLRDVQLLDGRLVLVDGSLEPQTTAERERFLRYLVAVASDDPDAAWDWIEEAATPGPGAESDHGLRNRLRQAVPFRDGEWSGDDRLGERLLVQWRTLREAGWTLHSHPLHLYRGIQAITSATTALAPDDDVLLAALVDERLRLGFADVRRVVDPRGVAADADRLLQDLIQLPQKLDDFLTIAADRRSRGNRRDRDADEADRARNRSALMLALVGAAVGIVVLGRYLAPIVGSGADAIGAAALLIVGAWLLVAAVRL